MQTPTLILQEHIATWKLSAIISSSFFATVLTTSMIYGGIGKGITDSIASIKEASQPVKTVVTPQAQVLPRVKPVKLSLRSIKDLETFSANIIGVSVSSINYKENTFSNSFTYSNSADLQHLLNILEAKDYPLFSSDLGMNARVMSVLNGDIDCRPFDETASFKQALGSYESIKYTCAVLMPPSRHKSNAVSGGFITALLKDDRMVNSALFKQRFTDLAIAIHERDFK